MTPLEEAIFAAAYLDALRNMFDAYPMPERVREAEKEARFVVEQFRKHKADAR